jgi:RsiW-degrading membrane proteinase PrsW (M82 family)
MLHAACDADCGVRPIRARARRGQLCARRRGAAPAGCHHGVAAVAMAALIPARGWQATRKHVACVVGRAAGVSHATWGTCYQVSPGDSVRG